ncbi:MAG: helicase-exonuclease AddAB subunit AddA [Lachnospiraceae bacterium]|nr:helicase-exonuclease AddAB subunit AddA [Lachnospiraceae bacterium]
MKFSPEQEKVINLRNKNILVSAAAGSGKTSVLVERVIKRVMDPDDNVDIDRILTVTFTNAAASEMKDRIRKRLSEALLSEPENERLREQLNLIHNASFMTIDAFCVKVIRENFEELSIDPAFRVGDENEMEMIREDACDEILNEAYEEGREDFDRLLSLCSPGKEDRDIAETLMTLSKKADSREDPEEWLKSLIIPYEKAETEPSCWEEPVIALSNSILGTALKEYDQLISLSKEAPGPYMYLPLLQDERAAVFSALAEKSYEKRYEALKLLTFDRLSSKKDEGVDPDLRTRVKDIRNSKKDLLIKLRNDLFSKDKEQVISELKLSLTAVRELVGLTLKYRSRTGEKKEKKGVLDFSDLEHFALSVLKSDAGDSYRDFYREVMTDEYQDNNGIQEAILTRVAGKNNYFCVGDVKQSIYGFRLSEPEIFMKRFKSYESDPDSERILLNRNYRSRSCVIASVNALFKGIMHEDTGGIEYDEDQYLYYGEGYDSDTEACKTELCLLERGNNTDIEKPELEAAYIASRIASMVGSFEITERKDGSIVKRKAGYSDFAVLLRTASGVDEVIRDVLKSRGIPAVTERTGGYFKTREVRDVLNFLNIIDNPRQDIPLIAVLKSPFGGLNDADLSLIRASHKEGLMYDALTKGEYGEELKEKAGVFLKKLERYREMLHYTPLHELIKQLIGEGYDLLAMTKNDGSRENLELLVKKAADFESTSYRGLFRFLRYIEKMKKYDLDFGEAGKTGGAEAVRIMSIHKSKGLEFPVVFLANADRQFNRSDATEAVIIHKDLGIGLNITDQERKLIIKPLLKNVSSYRIRLDGTGEEMRVLYVGLTRAKEKLFITGTVKDRNKTEEKLYSAENANSFLDFIMAALQSGSGRELSDTMERLYISPEELVEERVEEAEEMMLSREAVTASGAVMDSERYNKLSEELHFEYAHKAALITPSKVSVSELKIKSMEVEGEEPRDITELISEESEEEKKERKKEEKRSREAAALRGTVFHKVMSLLPPDLGYEKNKVEEFLLNLEKEGSLSGEERELVSVYNVQGFLKTPLYKRMSAADREHSLFREQPFIMGKQASLVFPGGPEDETVQIQGIIDAFFIEDGKIVVMDYKTDRVKDRDILIRRYRKQLELYGEALEQILKIPVAEKKIYSVCLNEEIEIL